MEESKKLQNEWIKDYQEFLASGEGSAPQALSKKILDQVSHLLNPSPLKVFAKLSLIHFIVGFVTLLFCPQFGLSLTSSMGLMHYLMPFGQEVCMLGCGAFFIGTSLLIASVILKPEEIRVLRRGKVIQLASLSTLSFGAFIALGADIVVGLGLVWILGAILGGAATLEFGNWFRKVATVG